MSVFKRSFDEQNGRITWQTVDESGDTFSLTLGPNDANDGLYIRIESNASVLYETSLSL